MTLFSHNTDKNLDGFCADGWLTAMDKDWFSSEHFQKENPGAMFRKAQVPRSPYEPQDLEYEEMMANDSLGG